MTRLNLLEPVVVLFRKTGSWETPSLILTEGIIKGSGQAEEQMHW